MVKLEGLLAAIFAMAIALAVAGMLYSLAPDGGVVPARVPTSEPGPVVPR